MSTPATTVLVPFARTKVDAHANITDPLALADVRRALDAFLLPLAADSA